MDVKQDGKTDTANETGKILHPEAPLARADFTGNTPERGGHIPGRGGTQGQRGGDQEDLDDSVDAGIGIAVNDVPHGVGKEQTGNQNHQGADDH